MDTSPKSAPPRWQLATVLVLCLAGLAVAGDLTSIHYNVHTDPAYVSFCAISQEVNCDAVAESDWSVFLGLPVSVWGLFGYVAMGLLAAWGLWRKASLCRGWPWGLLLLLSVFSAVVSAVLAVISKLVIHSMCVMCIASWGINLALLVLSALAVRRLGLRVAVREDLSALLSRPGLSLTLVLVAVALLGGTLTSYPRYWKRSGPQGPGTLKTGMDEHGNPWIGAAAPKLTIEEFSDYECPHCSRAHGHLRKLIEARADRVRLVHRNYPLDQACNTAIKRPFHLSACLRAKAASCAGQQGKFWEMNDLLFAGQKKRDLDVEALARRLGLDGARFKACLDSYQVAQHLDADMEAARRHSIAGTPSYVIGDAVLAGQLSEQELDKRLNSAQ